MGILTVYLDKVTNLADEDHLGSSDPYVKFELEQDNAVFDKDMGDKKSTTKKDEPNPVYGETFIWNIPEIKNMELTIKVMDDDIASDDKIGKTKIKLEDMDFSSGEPVVVERKVDNNVFAKDAYIYLTIKYEDP